MSAGTAWGWAVGLAMLGAACGPGKEDSASGSTSEATSTSTSTSTSTTGTVTGTPTTSDGSDSESGTNTGGTSSSSTTECMSCSDSSEGGGFIYAAPDMGGSGIKECDPWVQDCPIGQKCMPFAQSGVGAPDSLHCVPVAESPEQAGDPCVLQGTGPEQKDNCDVGLYCWDNSCVLQCSGTPDAPMCADPAAACLIANDEALTLCLPACDPLAQDCEADQVCLSAGHDQAFVCVQDASGDGGQEFEACELQNSCDPGLACLDSGWATECGGRGFECCLKFCDVTMPTCTGAGAACVSWFEAGMAPPGLEDVGVCRLPE